MEHLKEYLIPYTISNVAAIVILLASWKHPRSGRLLFALLFGWAAWMNSKTALTHPEFYLEYADMAIPVYSKFITGWFSTHVTTMILCIGFCQLLISIGMLLKNLWVKISCLGAITFLLAIAPLGVGSAFPFSIFASFAAFLIYNNPQQQYIWNK